MSSVDFDEVLTMVGQSGRYQTVMFLVLCLPATVPVAFLAFSNLFTTATPDHWCRAPPEFENLRLDESLLKFLTIPTTEKENGERSYSKCTMYDMESVDIYEQLFYTEDSMSAISLSGKGFNKSDNPFKKKNAFSIDEEWKNKFQNAISNGSMPIVKCKHGWNYDRRYYDNTLVTQLNLVCEDSWSPQTSTALFYVGSIFGNVFFGWVADRWGRRTSMLWMILLEVFVSIITCFSKDYTTYLALRTVGGLFFPALYQIPFILGIEMMAPKHRPLAGMIICIMFAGAMSLLALLAFLLRDWFKLSIATSIPFILLYSYYWIIPESPRWLLSKGKIDEADQILQTIARYNGVKIPKKFLHQLHAESSTMSPLISELSENDRKSSLRNGHIEKKLNDPPNLELKNINLKSTKSLYDVPYRKKSLSDQYDKVQYHDLKRKCDEWNIKVLCHGKENKHNDKSTTYPLMCHGSKNNIEIVEVENNAVRYNNKLDVAHSKQADIRDVVVQSNNIKTDNTNDIYQPKRCNMSENKNASSLKRTVSLQTDFVIKESIHKEATLLDIFNYTNIRKKFFLLTYVWIANAVVYNGLSYNTTNMGVNDFLAFFIAAVIEFPSNILAWKLMDIWGRRWVLCLALGIGGLGCLSCMFVPKEYVWVTVTFAMIGKFGVAASFSVFYVFVGESFPTVLRSQAMGLSSLIASIGLLMFPYILELAQFSKVIPMIILGLLSLSGSLASIFLPETLNSSMPQTLEEGENFGKNFKILSFPKRRILIT